MYYEVDYITLTLGLKAAFDIWELCNIACINSYSASRNNWCTVGGNGGCSVSEVRAGTTSPMPDHKGFKLQ